MQVPVERQDGALQALAARLARVVVRRPGVALGLWGEVGIGKTQTVQALLRGVPCRSLSVRAAQPLAATLRALPRPKRPSAWLERALERGGELAPEEGLPVLAALLAALAPFVLCAEDLHEADPAQTDIWGQLARSVSRSPGVGLLVSSREPLPGAFEAVRLAPLDRAASDALLEAEAGAPLPTEALRWLFSQAAGNPLYTLEYFRLLARQGSLWNDGQRWHWRPPRREVLPATVEALVEQALAVAVSTPEDLQALEAAALLEPHPAPDLWAQVAGLPAADLARAREHLRARGVWSDGDFAHPLYREVTLRRLPTARREGHARRALQALQADPLRAAAFVAAAGLPAAAALQHFERAAAVAHAAGREVQAARFEARAVDHASGVQRAELALRAARGLQGQDLPEASRLSELALAADLPGALDLRAGLLAAQGRLAEAEACLDQLPAEVRRSPGGVGRRIRLRAAVLDHPGVLALWDATPPLQAAPEPEVAQAVALALAIQGRLDEAETQAGRMLALPDLLPETASGLTSVLGHVCYARDDFQGAEAHFARVLAQVRAAGLTHLEAACLANRALALGALCRNHERLADLEAGMRLYLAAGRVGQAMQAQVAVADAHLDLGHYAQAEELLLECRDHLARQDVPGEHLIECEYRLSTLYRDWAPPHGGLLAVRHARAALTRARQQQSPRKLGWSLGYASMAESRAGDARQGRALADELLGVAGGLHSPGLLALARFAQAHALEAAGQRAAALAAFKAVEAELQAVDNLDAAHEVGLEADRLAGRADCAAVRLAWFERHEMVNMANVARRYFPGLVGAEGATSPTAASGLRLEVLGRLRWVDGAGARPVRGQRRQALLALLAEARLAGRAEVPRLDLTDALYPAAPEPQANAALRDLVHQVRAEAGAAALLTTAGGYALGDLQLDAEAFLAGGGTALWRGPYLEGLNLSLREESVTEALALGLRRRGEALLASDPAEAARLGRLLLEGDPYDLGALRLTLRALRAGGNHRGLGREYARARERLREVGERLPEHWADFLDPSGARA